MSYDLHDNPDVSRFVIRVDTFGPDNKPGDSPTAQMIEDALMVAFTQMNAAGWDFGDVLVEVEDRLA